MDNTKNIIDFLEAGMKVESLRQKAIASNVANAKTPGYRRLDVNFQKLLTDAIDKDGNVDLNNIEVGLYQPKNTPVKEDGNDVTIDYEVGQMVKNTLRHKTYTRLLNKVYSQMDLAINTSK